MRRLNDAEREFVRLMAACFGIGAVLGFIRAAVREYLNGGPDTREA